jgi:hypothetical protein
MSHMEGVMVFEIQRGSSIESIEPNAYLFLSSRLNVSLSIRLSISLHNSQSAEGILLKEGRHL